MALAERVVEVAVEVCGVKQKSVESPWFVGREAELTELQRSISAAVERRNEAARSGEVEELEAARERLKDVRRESKRARDGWEKNWWEGVLNECVAAEEKGDIGGLYRGLKKLGVRDMKKDTGGTKLTTEEFRNHFKKVSEERFENKPEEIEADFREGEEAERWRIW